jgi:hypothetical protein
MLVVMMRRDLSMAQVSSGSSILDVNLLASVLVCSYAAAWQTAAQPSQLMLCSVCMEEMHTQIGPAASG